MRLPPFQPPFAAYAGMEGYQLWTYRPSTSYSLEALLNGRVRPVSCCLHGRVPSAGSPRAEPAAHGRVMACEAAFWGSLVKGNRDSVTSADGTSIGFITAGD